MPNPGIKSWPLVGLGGGLIPLVAGLDAPVWLVAYIQLPLKIVSLIIILAGYALGSYALIENRFFSGMVRIQTDRGHQVVSGGPYRWMRHPGYAGALWPTWPRRSFWIRSGRSCRSCCSRCAGHPHQLEDRTLQDELEGYREYAERVRYRLLPGVW